MNNLRLTKEVHKFEAPYDEHHTIRRQLKTDLELPMRDEYGDFVRSLIQSSRPVDLNVPYLRHFGM